MPLHRLALILIAILALGEGALALWRHLPIEPSTAPVFSLPMMEEPMKQPGDFQQAVAAYKADRGAELELRDTTKASLTIFYFEWDGFRSDYEHIIGIAIHTPEACNRAAGFELQEILPERTHMTEGYQPLRFNVTRFIDPAGRTVFMFKMVWLQGRGSLAFRAQELGRMARLKGSLQRHRGAARVLQAGVFDAKDSDEAWQVFQSQILDHIQWRE